MSDNDPGPHSMIYAQVEPERIADVNWIMEGYEHLAMVSTVDGTSGLIKFYATPDTYFDTLDIIENMPFKVDVIDNMETECITDFGRFKLQGKDCRRQLSFFLQSHIVNSTRLGALLSAFFVCLLFLAF